jgi:16S rRNA (guanine966-N2)-methyltransferase
LSRGAKNAVFVDKSSESTDIIKDNLFHTKLGMFAQVLTSDYKNAVNFLNVRNEKFDIVFLDPPYNKGLVTDSLLLLNINKLLTETSIVICETPAAELLPDFEGQLVKKEERRYGDIKLTFYKYSEIE